MTDEESNRLLAVYAAAHFSSVVMATLFTLRSLTEEIYERGEDQEAESPVHDGTITEWVTRLDLLGNTLSSAAEEVLDPLRDAGQAVMLPDAGEVYHYQMTTQQLDRERTSAKRNSEARGAAAAEA